MELASDRREHSLEEAREALAQKFTLTSEDRAELLPSGRQHRFNNRVAWAKSFLDKARVLDTSRRGHFVITDRGRQLLAEKPKRIDVPLLERYEEFREFRARPPDATTTERQQADNQAATPEEQLEQAYLAIRTGLVSEILERVKTGSPHFFENLVVDLLVKMGYGGNRAEAGKAVVGGPGDEGIDGIINEDRLGLDTIYVQAKRWEGTVGRPEIQKFVGALHGKRARKGVFITTGTFS